MPATKICNVLFRFGALLGLLLAANGVSAAEVTNVSLRGLRSSGTTVITFDGTDLLPSPRLLAPFPIDDQKLLPGATDKRISLAVTLGNVPGSTYALRLASDRGVSRALVFAVDRLLQIGWHDVVDKFPSALSGSLLSPSVETMLSGKQGQRLVVEIEARRLGSDFDPVIELGIPGRGWRNISQPSVMLGGDSRVDVTLPATGPYSLQVHDLRYAAGAPNHFRLKFTDSAAPNLTYPLGGNTNGITHIELAERKKGADPLSVDLTSVAPGLSVPVPCPNDVVEPIPRLSVGELPEILEPLATAKPFDIPVPAVLNGRLDKSKEEDQFRLSVQPGMQLSIDVLAQRAGSALDGILTLRNEQNTVVAQVDDQPGTLDPGIDFTVPPGMKQLNLGIRDRRKRGGSDYVYRITVDRRDRPNFSLRVLEDRTDLPPGGASIFRVFADRRGYSGPIRLFVSGLPFGAQVDGAEIPMGAAGSLLSVSTDSQASTSASLMRIYGENSNGANVERRAAQISAPEYSTLAPWLKAEGAISVAKPGGFVVRWRSHPEYLPLGYRWDANLDFHLAKDFVGLPTRLTLLTNQIVPRTMDNTQEDMGRAIRLDGDAVRPTMEGAMPISVLIPADLPKLPYDLAIRAELLDKTRTRVLATCDTRPVRLELRAPLAVQLVGPAEYQVPTGIGKPAIIKGKVTRSMGFRESVVVTLTGLPGNVPATAVELSPTATEFELPIAFPFDANPQPPVAVQLVALSDIGINRTVTTAGIPVTLKPIVAKPTPPAAPLTRLFEDEWTFSSMLAEGDGTLTLEKADRYSGKSALRVTNVQRFRAAMPGWNYPVREKPGAGEFRYLQFAWKKRGGNNILLQLNANNQWGGIKGSGQKGYRYEAGPAVNVFNAEAVRVSNRLPADWEIVTRDLFKDFGAFNLTGMAFTPGQGEYGLFDHIYLAKSLDDLKSTPAAVQPEKPLAVFEDESAITSKFAKAGPKFSIDNVDRYTGTSSLRVNAPRKETDRLFGNGISIRRDPGPGEYRFIRFAWKKIGGRIVCLEFEHDNAFGPTKSQPASYRYEAGGGKPAFGAAVRVSRRMPQDWTIVERDLYADFGEFTLTDLSFAPVDGESALFDHIYLSRSPRDFTLCPKPIPKTPTK